MDLEFSKAAVLVFLRQEIENNMESDCIQMSLTVMLSSVYSFVFQFGVDWFVQIRSSFLFFYSFGKKLSHENKLHKVSLF